MYTAGRLYHGDPEQPFASGQGLFISQDIEKFKGLLHKDETLDANMEKARANMRL